MEVKNARTINAYIYSTQSRYINIWLHTSAGSPPTKILFGISVPYLGIWADDTGVHDGVSDRELSLDDDWQKKQQHNKLTTFNSLYYKDIPFNYIFVQVQCNNYILFKIVELAIAAGQHRVCQS